MTHLLLGAFINSFSALFVSFGTRYGISGPEAAYYRMLIGGIALFLVTLVSREPMAKVHRMPAAGFGWSFSCAAFFAADLLTWHQSILYSGPGQATLLGNLQVFVLALWGLLVLREKPSPRFFLGLVLAVAGLAVIVAPSWAARGEHYRLGVAYGVAGGLFYGGFLLSMARCMAVCGVGSQLAVNTVFSLMTAVLIAPVLLWRGEPLLLGFGAPLLLMAGYGLALQLFGWVFISIGLRETRVATAGLILLIQPVLTYVWDILFVSKTTTPLEVLGVIATMAGVGLGAMHRRRPGGVAAR